MTQTSTSRVDMETCIALRTIVWRNGTFNVQTGADVVADFVPGAKFEETMSKARRCSRRCSSPK